MVLNLVGVAWDGTYVRCSSKSAPKYGFQMTIGVVGVAPASFGKVKALFR